MDDLKPAAGDSINLALQGGGAHGAFTWGVLDRLLEDPTLAFDGISGTSAGALNACVMAAGWAEGGRDGARAALERFWRGVSEFSSRWTPAFAGGTPFAQIQQAMAHWWLEGVARTLSPYQLNPLGVNPLRPLIEELIDFDAVRRCNDFKLFVCATNVLSGRARIFANHELSIDALLASACLPQLFQAVEIDGEHYWDGGYRGNPALYPLIYHTAPNDILLVLLNPLKREKLPRNASDIADRVNEITFNAPLLAELRAIDFVARLLDQGLLSKEAARRYRRIHIHAVGADGFLDDLKLDSKLAPEWGFLENLRDRGRAAADAWLARHRGDIGHRTTVDLRGDFLD